MELKNSIKTINYANESSKRSSENNSSSIRVIGTDYTYKHEIVWKNAIGFLILHLLGLWGLFVVITGGVQFRTFLWTLFLIAASGLGITIGAHRFYTHRTFKAKPILRALLVILQTAAGQNSMFVWCRDHRLHHRYSDTDADPHNAKRGFFFSHMGWLMTKKHPLVIELGRKTDLSDLQADWMVMFQKKYYFPLYVFFAILIPVWVPIYFFNEPWLEAILVAFFCKYILLLNGTWLVNSAAHLYGTRPYDKNLNPVESWFVSWITLGEGWHNYHHAFPWDYKTAELPNHLNFSTRIIDLMAKLGLAYDLKSVSSEVIKNRIKRTGDGTHYEYGDEESKSAVTAFGPLHPLNPTYNVTYPPPEASLNVEMNTFDFSNVTVKRKVGITK